MPHLKQTRIVRGDLQNRPTFYRWLAGGLTFLAIALALWRPHWPGRVRMPDPFAYQTAIIAFAQGHLTLSDAELERSQMSARLEGGQVVQYAALGPDRWALRKAPGYPLLVVPFQWLHRPGLANATLAILAALALYAWLAEWANEAVACLGVLLYLWSPITLVALHTWTMDTFASGATLLIGACCLFSAGRQPRNWLWFAGGLAIGLGLFVRLQNLPLCLLLLLWVTIRHWKGSGVWYLLVGFGLPLLLLLVYNQAVFGHFLDSGYRYPSPYQSLFLWESNPATQIAGRDTWLANPGPAGLLLAVGQHLVWWLEPLLRGWPLWPLSLFGLWFYWPSERAMSWLMALWLLLTYAPYAGVVYFGVSYELTVPFYRGWGFFALDRYLFPAGLPFIYGLLCWLRSGRDNATLYFSLIVLYLALGGTIFWLATG